MTIIPIDIDSNTNANYYEFILTKNNGSSEWTMDDMKKYMQMMTNNNYKYFQKNFKEQIWNTTYYQNYNNDDIKVIRKDVITINNTNNNTNNLNILTVGYNKSKLSLLNIPSSLDFYSSYFVNRLTFRVSNRIYVNFEIKTRDNDKNFIKIYVNYNHDSNVDITQIKKQLQDVINQLTLE